MTAKRKTRLVTSIAAGPGVVEEAVEPALLEGEDDDAERRRQRQRVHQQRLDRQDHRAGQQEEEHAAWSAQTIADHQRHVVDQALLLVDEAGGVAGDQRAVAAGGAERADLVHRVLRLRGERRSGERRSWRRRPRSEARTKGAPLAMPSIASDPAVGSAASCGVAGAAVDGDRDRLGDVARVVGLDVAVDVVGGLVRAARPRRWGRSASVQSSGEAARAAARCWPSATPTGRRITQRARRYQPSDSSETAGPLRIESALIRVPSSASSEGTTSSAITAESTATEAPATAIE